MEYQPQLWVCRSDYHNVWLGEAGPVRSQHTKIIILSPPQDWPTATKDCSSYSASSSLTRLAVWRSVQMLVRPETWLLCRQVKQINDSRLVGMSIYNVAILCIITAPVTMVIADQENATFAFVALANVFCCYLSMALVFVPKVRNVNIVVIWSKPPSQVVFIIQHPGHDPREREDEDEKKKLEQESKLKKLLKENEELQKDIAEVSWDYIITVREGRHHHRICLLQKDRKIGILRKHIAMKRELAEREQERQRRDTEIRQRENDGYNGTCR